MAVRWLRPLRRFWKWCCRSGEPLCAECLGPAPAWLRTDPSRDVTLFGRPACLLGTRRGLRGGDVPVSLLFADTPLPEKEILYPAEPARAALPSGGPFHVCSPPAAPAAAPLSPASLGKTDTLSILSRNATHPLLHISTLYEAREEEDGGPRAPPDVGSLIAIPPPQQILIATFDEPRTVVSTVEF